MRQRTVEITCIFCHRSFLVALREEEQPMKCPYCKAELWVRLPMETAPTPQRGERGGIRQEPHPPTPAVMPSPAQQLRMLTRYSEVSLPSEAQVGEEMSLLVRITLQPLSADALKLELEQQDKMEVTVIARPNGLELLNADTQRLSVPLTENSGYVHFTLVGRQVGAASVTVHFFQNDRYLGSVTAETNVKEPDADIHADPRLARGNVSFAGLYEEADLVILVDENGGRYQFTLLCPKVGAYYRKMGDRPMPPHPALWADEEMKNLTRQSQQLSAVSDKLLAGFGARLFDDLCPKELQDFYWSHLHRQDEVKTALILSSEPWIPWEMVKPHRKEGGKIETAPHWCERFVMGRWLNGPTPPMTLPRGTVAVIAPRDVDFNPQDEVDMLQRIGLALQRVEAKLKDVIPFLESDGCAGFHVASHGHFKLHNVDQSDVWLEKVNPLDEDSRELFTPTLIGGAGAQFGLSSKPLAFFNTCNCGRSDFHYWGLGGWAKAMVLKAECSAFLAPFWEVETDRALKFAEAVYTELYHHDKTLGEAVLQARESIKGTDNPTWLAYCLYAHPRARLGK